jgi:hypothetical protein
MTEATELKPCPLCQSVNVRLMIGLSEIVDGEVHCSDCGCSSGNHPTGLAATQRWNTRALPQAGASLTAAQNAGPVLLEAGCIADKTLAAIGEALDHELRDVELEAALHAVGIGVYGPDATKFETMFAAAMKCRATIAQAQEPSNER